VVAIQVSLKASASTLWRCADLGGPWWAQHSVRMDRSASAPSISTRSPDGTVIVAGFSFRPSCWLSKSSITRSASRCSRELPGGSSWPAWMPAASVSRAVWVTPAPEARGALSGCRSWFPSHSLTIFRSGPGRRRTVPALSSSRQIWLTLCRGEMPARSASWSSSRGLGLIRIASMMRSRRLPVSMLPAADLGFAICRHRRGSANRAHHAPKGPYGVWYAKQDLRCDRWTRTMLLCLSMARMMFSFSICGSSGNGVLGAAAVCGQDREGPLRVEGRLLLGQCDTRSHAVSGCVDWRTS
jgi:hypothetical protein